MVEAPEVEVEQRRVNSLQEAAGEEVGFASCDSVAGVLRSVGGDPGCRASEHP